jgi:hypothetical protein
MTELLTRNNGKLLTLKCIGEQSTGATRATAHRGVAIATGICVGNGRRYSHRETSQDENGEDILEKHLDRRN